MTVDEETIRTLRQLHTELKLDEEVNMIREGGNLKEKVVFSSHCQNSFCFSGQI